MATKKEVTAVTPNNELVLKINGNVYSLPYKVGYFYALFPHSTIMLRQMIGAEECFTWNI